MTSDIKSIISRHKLVISNISYITLLQLFLLIAPLITYPYLVKVLGMELYGMIITAQVLVSVFTLIIDFGSNSVCAKFISENVNDKHKLSEVFSSVLTIRCILAFICFLIYMFIVLVYPDYYNFRILFLLSYGLTFHEILFPQYFFQGIQKMQYITMLNIGTRLFFILMIFIFVRSSSDYLLVPIFYSIGYLVSGVLSIFIIVKKINVNIYFPSIYSLLFYIKQSSSIFFTDMICLIKDKLNYFLIGAYVNMADVVIYDIGSKLLSVLSKPASIITTVFFPIIAKSKDTKKINHLAIIIFAISFIVVIFTQIFLPHILNIFVDEIPPLLPIRILLLSPIFLSISSFYCSNGLIALGYNKYVLYSIIITVSIYIVCLIVSFLLKMHNAIMCYIVIALISYFGEFLYRAIIFNKLINK